MTIQNRIERLESAKGFRDGRQICAKFAFNISFADGGPGEAVRQQPAGPNTRVIDLFGNDPWLTDEEAGIEVSPC